MQLHFNQLKLSYLKQQDKCFNNGRRNTSKVIVKSSNYADYKVAVFSAQRYVVDFLQEPLCQVFPNSKLIDARLSSHTAPLAQGFDAVIAFVNDTADREVLETFKDGGVTSLALRCAGYDKVDLKAAKELGIRVARVPTYSPVSVAEHGVALLLSLMRNVTVSNSRLSVGNFALSGLVGREIGSMTVGVWGVGAIGSNFVRIMRGFGCRVIAFDRRQNPEQAEQLGFEFVDEHTLVSECDVLSIHCPLTPNTKGMINQDVLSKMKPSSVLINVSRGALVDTRALINALEGGQIAGAALDVYENEDSLFFQDRSQLSQKERMKKWDRDIANLIALPNCLITPHIAFLTDEALGNIASTTIDNLKAFADALECANEIITKK